MPKILSRAFSFALDFLNIYQDKHFVFLAKQNIFKQLDCQVLLEHPVLIGKTITEFQCRHPVVVVTYIPEEIILVFSHERLKLMLIFASFFTLLKRTNAQ